LQALRDFQGTPYHWGGESERAIDCSGLIRASMRRAVLREFIRRPNPYLLHLWAKWWWCDQAARDFADARLDLALPLFDARSIHEADSFEALNPGDIAVTIGGEHILAYLGDHRWVQAEPDRSRVVIDTLPTLSRWYTVPVHILRLKWW
jgi:cell wall-associated NlpC family hydrolase